MKSLWENIDSDTARLKVPGGWLVRYDNEVVEIVHGEELQSGYQWRSSMNFVPDPNHDWVIVHKTVFKEAIFEIAFGDDAISKGYSEEDVIAELRMFSDQALDDEDTLKQEVTH